MAASSDHSARARVWVAFLLLFVVLAAVSVGVYYLGKLQETMAALEGRIALDAINAGQIDAALAGHPSNRFPEADRDGDQSRDRDPRRRREAVAGNRAAGACKGHQSGYREPQ